MNLPLTKNWLFAASFTLLFLIAAAITLLSLATRDTDAVAARSSAAQQSAQNLLLTFVDAETGMRGYVLTGNSRFTDPYHVARASFASRIGEVERASQGSPNLSAASGDIVEQSLRSFSMFDRYVNLVGDGRRARATAEIARGSGKRVMDGFRGAVAVYERAQQARSEAAVAASRRARSATDALLGLGALVFAGSFVALYATCGSAIRGALRGRALGPAADTEPDSQARSDALASTNVLQRAILDGSDRAMITTGTDGIITSFNGGAARMLGYTSEEVVGHWTPEQFRLVDEPSRGKSRDGLSESTFVRADGTLVPIQTRTTPLNDGGGKLYGYLNISEDITQRKMAERAVVQIDLEQREFARQFRLIANTVATAQKDPIDRSLNLGLQQLGLEWAFVATVSDGTGLLVIDSSVTPPGLTNGPSIGIGTSVPQADAFIGNAPRKDDVYAATSLSERREPAADAAFFGEWEAYIAAPIYVSGALYGVIGFLGKGKRSVPFSPANLEFVRVTADLVAAAIERGHEGARLSGLAFFDTLTGLPNRALLLDRLTQTIHAAKRYDETFALLYLDLDAFKSVNDTYGHTVGDEVLRAASRRFEKLLRVSDTVARYGGDEFVIIAPKIFNELDASDLASRIVLSMRRPFVIDDVTYLIGVSIGVSVFPHDGADAIPLMEAADRALYAAKANGKNTFSLSSDGKVPSVA